MGKKYLEREDELVAKIEQLQAELEKHRWIPVSEGLPEIGQEILGYFPDFVGSKYCITVWWKEALDELDNLTHWKPIHLPEPKKEKPDCQEVKDELLDLS